MRRLGLGISIMVSNVVDSEEEKCKPDPCRIYDAGPS
jgi:hypothetical protein